MQNVRGPRVAVARNMSSIFACRLIYTNMAFPHWSSGHKSCVPHKQLVQTAKRSMHHSWIKFRQCFGTRFCVQVHITHHQRSVCCIAHSRHWNANSKTNWIAVAQAHMRWRTPPEFELHSVASEEDILCRPNSLPFFIPWAQKIEFESCK